MASIGKRNTIIVGLMLIVGAVAMIALIPMAISASESPKCPLVGLDKLPRPGRAKSVASRDGKALVNFDAYLQYDHLDDEDTEFVVPLNLNSIEVIEDKKNPDHRQLVLNSDCAQLKINFENISIENEVLIAATGISVQLETANRGLQSCTVEGMEAMSRIRYSPDKHYSGWRYTFVCEADEPKKGAAKLVAIPIFNLAIELDGNAEKHRNGEFSKPADTKH